MTKTWKSWNRLSDAAICRQNGWTAGTRLIGDEGYGPTVIEITAIGREMILAEELSPHPYPEGIWTLHCRKWRKTRKPVELYT